jgi:toxin YoeB
MRLICFDALAFQLYQEWITLDKRIAFRIGELIKDIQRNPFEGIGKPEALKHLYKGYWSRRITDEHRLVYKVDDTHIYIAQCKYHYTK